MSMTGGRTECLFGNQSLKSSHLWLFMFTSFNQAEFCREERKNNSHYFYSQNMSRAGETIWNASVQFDKQDWVEICDLNPHGAFVATSYWLRLLAWTGPSCAPWFSLSFSDLLGEPQFLSWPQTHVRIYCNLYWSFQKFSYISPFHRRDLKLAKLRLSDWSGSSLCKIANSITCIIRLSTIKLGTYSPRL